MGVAQAAFEAAIRYSQQRETFGVPISQHQAIQLKLADMATKIQAARLLTYDAAAKKDSGARVDLETGMAKLFASEICGEVTMDAMRIHGGYGYIKESPVERYYRDAPLMIIGEGTNEILRLVIARQLLRRPEIPGIGRRTPGLVRVRFLSPYSIRAGLNTSQLATGPSLRLHSWAVKGGIRMASPSDTVYSWPSQVRMQLPSRK